MQARHLVLHPRSYNKLKRILREARSDGEVRVANRINAVILNAEGKTSGEISTTLKASRSKVSKWLKSYEDSGFEGILEGHRSGRPRLLSEQQEQQLSDIIESGPVSYGYLSGVWTSIMIRDVITDEFAVPYHAGHVRKILRNLGFSVQRPKRVLANADPLKQAKWKRYTYPNIKKKRKRPMPR